MRKQCQTPSYSSGIEFPTLRSVSSTFRLQMGREGEEEQQYNMIVQYQHGVIEEYYNIKFFSIIEKILAYLFMFATLQFTRGTWIFLRNGHQNNNYHDNLRKVDAL